MRRGAKLDGVPSGERSDKVGVRQPETLRAGSIRANSIELWLVRTNRYDLRQTPRPCPE